MSENAPAKIESLHLMIAQHFHCARCGMVVLGTIRERYDPNQPGVKGWCDECQSSIRR